MSSVYDIDRTSYDAWGYINRICVDTFTGRRNGGKQFWNLEEAPLILPKMVYVTRDPQPKSTLRSIPLLVVLLALAAGAGYYFYQSRNMGAFSESFEIKNFSGDPKILAENTWKPIERGMSFNRHQVIKTAGESEVDLEMPDKIRLRLKGDSELKGTGFKKGDKISTHHLELSKGTLLLATDKQLHEKNETLEVSTPILVTAVRGSIVYIHADQKPEKTWVGVLKGSAELRSKKAIFSKPVLVKSLEKGQMKGWDIERKPMRVSREEWTEMKEAYELIQKGAAFEAAQMDLSKSAGDFFQNVFDHGTFYTPKIGFSQREFILDESTKQVHLQIDYDVFPQGSFVGVYFKTRDLDIAQFEALEFEARSLPDTPAPEEFIMELKARNSNAKVLKVQNLEPLWKTHRLPLGIRKPTSITEVTFVFSHEKIGEEKQGSLQIKNVKWIPKSKETLEEERLEAAVKGEEAKPSAASSPAAVSAETSQPSSAAKKVKLTEIPLRES